MKPGKRKALDKLRAINRLADEIERIKASVRSQGRASTSGHQAAVRPSEGTFSGLGEEHGAAEDLVRAVESVDGS
jgi:phage tail tape-measure protein